MNYQQEAKELAAQIETGESGERTPVYYQTAASYGAPVNGDTYVEINLTAQHLFFYKDGQLVMESDFVSGNSARGYDTPEGTYSITYKQRNATLVGENYETPVSYWSRSTKISVCMMLPGDPALEELFTRRKGRMAVSICLMKKHRSFTAILKKERR